MGVRCNGVDWGLSTLQISQRRRAAMRKESQWAHPYALIRVIPAPDRAHIICSSVGCDGGIGLNIVAVAAIY